MRFAIHHLWVLLCAALLSACTVQLLPSYDAALAEGLIEASDEALTLFAALEQGSPTTEFSEFEDRYSALIGKLDGLRHRATTRDLPPLARRLARSDEFARICANSSPEACLNASPDSITTAANSIRMMRDTHRQSNLTGSLVTGFRRDFLIAISRASHVEQSLNRKRIKL